MGLSILTFPYMTLQQEKFMFLQFYGTQYEQLHVKVFLVSLLKAGFIPVAAAPNMTTWGIRAQPSQNNSLLQ